MRTPILTLLAMLHCGLAAAQVGSSPRYFPLDHREPGKAATWNVAIDPTRHAMPQPVEFQAPEGATISVLAAAGETSHAAPARGTLLVGRSYRLKISGVAAYPGIDVYPTVEMVDHLHAPAGIEMDFPVPITITEEDVEAAMHDRLVTKVIYLEQSTMAFPAREIDGPRTMEFSPKDNLMQAADERGRPIAILRMGGRQHDPQNPQPDFYGTGGMVPLMGPPAKVERPVATNAEPAGRVRVRRRPAARVAEMKPAVITRTAAEDRADVPRSFPQFTE
jgi:hypothetical protein